MECVNKVIAWLEEGKEVRNGMDQWTTSDVDFINSYQLLTAKPVIYLINLTKMISQRKKGKWLVKIHEWVQAHGGGTIIPPPAPSSPNYRIPRTTRRRSSRRTRR